jgi:hypothetical protein
MWTGNVTKAQHCVTNLKQGCTNHGHQGARAIIFCTVLPKICGFSVWKLSLCLYSKVQQSHYRPWQALRVPEVWCCQILRQSAHDGGKFVSPTHRPPLQQEIFLVFISVRDWVDPRAIVRPEELRQWKNPVTPSGIEPATFRFVARYLNHYATARPMTSLYSLKFWIEPWIVYELCTHLT